MAYEVLPNYDSPGIPSKYWWNALRRGRLPTEGQKACQECYPVTGGCGSTRGAKEANAQGLMVPGGGHDGRTNTVLIVNKMCVDLTELDNDG